MLDAESKGLLAAITGDRGGAGWVRACDWNEGFALVGRWRIAGVGRGKGGGAVRGRGRARLSGGLSFGGCQQDAGGKFGG